MAYHYSEHAITLPSRQRDTKCHLSNWSHSRSLLEEQLHHIQVSFLCCPMKGCPAILHIQTITASTAAPETQYSVSQSCGLSADSRWTIKWVRPWGLLLQICQKGCAILNLPSKWVFSSHLLAKKLHFIGMHPSHLHVLCFFCTNTQYGQPSLGVPGLVSFCCTVWSTWVRFTCEFRLRLCLFFNPIWGQTPCPLALTPP